MAEIALEEFLKWIRTDTNPKRVQNGLEPISDEEAKKCYEIMQNFLQNWSRSPGA